MYIIFLSYGHIAKQPFVYRQHNVDFISIKHIICCY